MFKYELYKETTDLAILLKKGGVFTENTNILFFRYEFARMKKTTICI